MKIYFLLWDGLPCDEDGFITARLVKDELRWLDAEDRTAMWDNPDEPLAFIKKQYGSNYRVYAVEV